jgi:hypothetical protein
MVYSLEYLRTLEAASPAFPISDFVLGNFTALLQFKLVGDSEIY